MDRGGREQVGEGITWWAMSAVTFLACGHPETQHCGKEPRKKIKSGGEPPWPCDFPPPTAGRRKEETSRHPGNPLLLLLPFFAPSSIWSGLLSLLSWFLFVIVLGWGEIACGN